MNTKNKKGFRDLFADEDREAATLHPQIAELEKHCERLAEQGRWHELGWARADLRELRAQLMPEPGEALLPGIFIRGLTPSGAWS